MFYDQHTREIMMTVRPVQIGGSVGIIFPKNIYILNKKFQYAMEIKITNLTLKQKEDKKKWYQN